ncbi:hypothetical protein [Microseira wollei]|nr:hypothetical protein [Microseira wollei]
MSYPPLRHGNSPSLTHIFSGIRLTLSLLAASAIAGAVHPPGV